MLILNISANKKGLAPNANIGLSHPINVPNHNNPKIYIVEDYNACVMIKTSSLFFK